VKPARFDYLRAGTLAEAHALLASEGEDARVIAGGQSLLPMLSMRLARPKVLIDIMHLPELAKIEADGNIIRIGAGVRQAELLAWPALAERQRLGEEYDRFTASRPHTLTPAERDQIRAGDRLRGDFIGLAALAQIREPVHLERRGCDDEFAARLDRNVVFGAKLLGLLIPCAAKARFQGAGRVIDSGMNDAAVVAGLVCGKVRLLLKQHQTGAGPALEDFTSGCQANDATAHHAEVITHARSQDIC